MEGTLGIFLIYSVMFRVVDFYIFLSSIVDLKAG